MSADVTGSERTGHVFFVELCADLPCVLRNFSYLLTVPLPLPGSRAYLERRRAGRAGAVPGKQEPGRYEVRPHRPSHDHVDERQGGGRIAQGGRG